MSTTTTEVQDRKVQNQVYQFGAPPRLFTVPGGTYVTTSYGSGTAAAENYDTATLRGNTNSLGQTSSKFRQDGKDIDFITQITLDTEAADPIVTDTGEIRIQTFQPIVAGQPARYRSALPTSDPDFGLPLFWDVEILDVATGAPPAAMSALTGSLQARYLYGGELAIVSIDTTTGPFTVTPITDAVISGIFGGAADSKMRIVVRGSYRGSAKNV